ncbi:hypothetical protein AUEXF2481DRAFT_35076 [Aureobasidium subglaciale EXF-2481]|uniref:F-box domain-containing protein n=1 Tax=Aureobasidium subglaciale (strain EXF-2481) TaxID=1043005 RepID=A0A074ZRC0_AURSE|nr:uncharacterized protein AUEXF2481DRAFT_35076 [Aureobasidium subglaciale EXF-2481]KER00827.1 hypothetical protein AUEXF2481DRAFT_35076 [Aureobasidium subglaciale EXF-2481]
MLALLNLNLTGPADPARLKGLAPDVWCNIFSYLDTAQSIARLESTCKSLHDVVRTHGWPTFVRSQFGTLTIPQDVKIDKSKELAKKLTWQSRSWDRRAFSLVSLGPGVGVPVARRGGRGRGGHGRGRNAYGGRHNHRTRSNQQTLPAHVVVDACSSFDGDMEAEIVAWGLGEDIVVRWRETERLRLTVDSWMTLEGAQSSFRSGTDDVTAISILRNVDTDPPLLVGRASGDLRLVSTSQSDFGRVIASYQPFRSDGGESRMKQDQIQYFDTNASSSAAAVVTKDSMFIYPLIGTTSNPDQISNASEPVIRPVEALDLGTLKDAPSFGSLRAIKFMADGDLALCAVRSTEPVRYLTRTPTGVVLTNLGKRCPSSRCTESFVHDGSVLQSARDLLPVNMASAAGASGKVILSSYDDGTVRLQDLRSHAAFDTIYQDHFELVTPMGPLVSHGLERFVAGSARNSILKIFDFRWNRTYSYIDAHPCSGKPMIPTPKSLTLAPLPDVAKRDACCHLSGYPCYLHALARTDFYRPNCNVYLPTINHTVSPVYSLAKSSDLSSSVYAGLSGELSRMSLRDPVADLAEKSWMQQSDCKTRCGYVFCEGSVSIVETGDGIALSDISKSKRLPALYKQNLQRSGTVPRSYQRLDESLY